MCALVAVRSGCCGSSCALGTRALPSFDSATACTFGEARSFVFSRGRDFCGTVCSIESFCSAVAFVAAATLFGSSTGGCFSVSAAKSALARVAARARSRVTMYCSASVTMASRSSSRIGR